MASENEENQRIKVHRANLTAPAAGVLIGALNAELSERYPEDGANHFRLDPEEVEEGKGAFLIARLDGKPAACGAIRRLDRQTAEIKRMYVSPEVRGHGIGRLVLSAEESQR